MTTANAAASEPAALASAALASAALGSAVLPPALKAGDVIAVVAPSSPFHPTLVWLGLGFLARRYRIRFTRGLFARDGYLAGADSRRAGELRDALADPEVRAIVAARGGFGANRIASEIDWSQLRRDPKWMVGFSDITALHVEAARESIASVHGCHVTALGQSNARARDGIIRVLEAPTRPRVLRAEQALCPGRAQGPLFGGNLAVLHACAAAGRLQVPAGAVLLIEDVGERPYRIDRMLCTLQSGGYLDQIAAVVAGDFEACEPGPDGTTVADVLVRTFASRGIPVALGLPIGHGLRNEPVVLGAPASVLVEGDVARVVVSARGGASHL